MVTKQNLAILNSNPKCKGKWTRIEGDCKSILDYIIVEKSDENTKICGFNQCFISVKNAMVDYLGNIMTHSDLHLIISVTLISVFSYLKQKIFFSVSDAVYGI